MKTNQQAMANKNNAAKSTGPKTEGGKASVSGNALKHGLQSSTKLLLHDEDPPPSPGRIARRPERRVAAFYGIAADPV